MKASQAVKSGHQHGKQSGTGEMSHIYALQVGQSGSARLDLQHSLIKNDSELHVLEAGLKAGMHILELGCGSGAMTTWFAQLVGEQGYVTAIDISAEQIECAKQAAREQQIDNIDFICSDIQALEQDVGTIDIIYCRCVLMHLRDPLAILKRVMPLLKAGGAIVCQEPKLSSGFSVPEDSVFTQMNRALLKISENRKVDYDLGPKLRNLIHEAGYKDVKLHFSQRAITIEQMQALLLPVLVELESSFIELGAATQAELAAWIAHIEQYAVTDDAYYVLPQQAHVTAYT